MLEGLRPVHRIESVCELSLDWLAREELRGLLVDLDDTLLDDRARVCAPDIRAWLGTLRAAGLRVCVVSNSGRRRVTSVTGTFEPPLPFVCCAGKPMTGGLRAALRVLALPVANVALVGDQLFTDVLGGHRVGVRTILVRSTARERGGEGWLTRLKRPFERLVLGEALSRKR